MNKWHQYLLTKFWRSLNYINLRHLIYIYITNLTHMIQSNFQFEFESEHLQQAVRRAWI